MACRPSNWLRSMVRASADGKVFICGTGSGTMVLRIDGERLEEVLANQLAENACPDEKGERIYSRGAVFDGHGKPLAPTPDSRLLNATQIPSVEGNFDLRTPQSMAISREEKVQPVTVTLCAGETQTLLALPACQTLAKQPNMARNPGGPAVMGLEKQVYLVPGAASYALLPSTGTPGPPPLQHRGGIERLRRRLPDGAREPRRRAWARSSTTNSTSARRPAGSRCTLNGGPEGMSAARAER